MEFISYVSVINLIAHLLLRGGEKDGKLSKISWYEHPRNKEIEEINSGRAI